MLNLQLLWYEDTASGYVTDVAFSVDGSLLAISGMGEPAVRVGDARAAAALQLLNSSVGVTAVCVDSARSLIVGGREDGVIAAWDMQGAEPARTLVGHGGVVSDLVLSPDAGLLASSGVDGTIRLWDVAAWAQVRTLRQPAGSIACLAVSDGARALAGGGENAAVYVWDMASGSPIWSLEGHNGAVSGVAFPSGYQPLLISGGLDGLVRVWDVDAGVGMAAFGPYGGAIWSLAAHPTLPVVALGSFRESGRVSLVDWRTGATVGHVDAPADEVDAVAFSPDGRLLACCANGKAAIVAMWEIAATRE